MIVTNGLSFPPSKPTQDVVMSALGAIGFFSGAIALAVFAYHWKEGYMPHMYENMPHLTHIPLDYIKQCIVPLVSITAVS